MKKKRAENLLVAVEAQAYAYVRAYITAWEAQKDILSIISTLKS